MDSSLRSAQKIRCFEEKKSYHTLQSQSFHLTRQEMVNRPDLHVIIVQRHMHVSHFVLKAKENCKLVINRNHGEELIAEVNQVKDGPIWLKVEVDRLTRRFLYSYDGEDWSEAGVLNDCITCAMRCAR